MSDKKFVLFLDILGFSQLVLNNKPDQIKQIYDSEIHQTASACTMIAAGTFGSTEGFKVTSEGSGKLVDIQQNTINFHVMSDSLIAWTNDTSLQSLNKISQYAAAYLSMTLALGLPHRGAISVGEIQLIELPLNGKLQANVIGSGVVNAHNFEVGQEWMGCVVDPECLKELSSTEIHEFFRAQLPSVIRCTPPYKEQTRPEYRSDLAINWGICGIGIKDDKSFFVEQFSRHNKGTGSSIKVDNTYEFYCRYSSKSKAPDKTSVDA